MVGHQRGQKICGSASGVVFGPQKGEEDRYAWKVENYSGLGQCCPRGERKVIDAVVTASISVSLTSLWVLPISIDAQLSFPLPRIPFCWPPSFEAARCTKGRGQVVGSAFTPSGRTGCWIAEVVEETLVSHHVRWGPSALLGGKLTLGVFYVPVILLSTLPTLSHLMSWSDSLPSSSNAFLLSLHWLSCSLHSSLQQMPNSITQVLRDLIWVITAGGWALQTLMDELESLQSG